MPSWRDRMRYGVLLPALLVGGVTVLLAFVPAPPSLPAAAAYAGFLALGLLFGVRFALVAWRARLTVSPFGVGVRTALHERLVPWNRLHAIEVGRPYRYPGRQGRGPGWQALHVRVEGERLPLVAAASNRPASAMPALVRQVERALGAYGHQLKPAGGGPTQAGSTD